MDMNLFKYESKKKSKNYQILFGIEIKKMTSQNCCGAHWKKGKSYAPGSKKCNLSLAQKLQIIFLKRKGTVMQTEKALINDRLSVSNVS